jgi:hypothetical protein
MATPTKKVNMAPAQAPELMPPEGAANLPAVIPLTASPVALGTLQASTPGALVAGATELATELARIIDRQRLATVIQGRRFVNVEGWTTLGIMLGCVAREVQTVELDSGVYVAVVELVRMADGACISRASAECGDEKPWNTRPKYARRSMAQTRATGKACRLAFSWIMSLAGYEVTPAEEMPPVAEVVKPEPQRYADEWVKDITLRLLDMQIREYELPVERVKAWLKKAWDISDFADLTSSQFDRLLQKLDDWKAAEYAKAEAAAAQNDLACPF